MKCLIITGGEISDDFACEEIKNGGYEIVMAVDSGMEFFHRVQVEPDIIVGDFDSVDGGVLEHFREKEYIEICMLDSVKDDTDTEHAVYEAMRRGADKIRILGGTGGNRLDHVIGNIGLLGCGLDQDVSIELVDMYNRVRMISKGTTVKKEKQFGKFISLIPVSLEVKGLTISGTKYDITDYTLKAFSARCVSNEIVEEEAVISFDEGILLLIESSD